MSTKEIFAVTIILLTELLQPCCNWADRSSASQMRKWRLEEFKRVAPNHPARRQQFRNMHPGMLMAKTLVSPDAMGAEVSSGLVQWGQWQIQHVEREAWCLWGTACSQPRSNFFIGCDEPGGGKGTAPGHCPPSPGPSINTGGRSDESPSP